jgi:hypothetical protein
MRIDVGRAGGGDRADITQVKEPVKGAGTDRPKRLMDILAR